MHTFRSRFLCYLPLVMLVFLVASCPLYASQGEVAGTQWLSVESRSDGVSGRLLIRDWRIVEDEYGQRVELDGGTVGEDPLPRFSTWITVPNGSGVTAELFTDGGLEETGIHYLPAVGMEPHVIVGEPAIFHGIRLFPLTIVPVSVQDDGMVHVMNEMVLEVAFEGTDNRAPVEEGPVNVSVETHRLLAAHVMNLDEIELVEIAPLGRLLIVAENNTAIRAAIQPYVDWKIEQGYPVTVTAPTSTSSYSAIKSLIQSEYDSDDPIPLEYVLIVGDADGSIDMAAYSSVTDHYYAQLDGNDILADVAIGRFSVQSTTELMRVTNKTLAYERDVYMEDTSWLEDACLAAGSGSGITPIQTNRTLKRYLQDHDIISDTLWYTMGGSIPSFMVNSINNGVSWVNFRGYYGMAGWTNSNADQCNNGSRLPIFVTITCGTGTWASQTTALSEGIFRAGSGVNTFKCGVVCLGTATTGTHTRFNNVVDIGFFEAPLQQNVRSVGWALVNGKLRLYEGFNGIDNSGVTNFSYWNNLMGDPTLRAWIGVPRVPVVEHEETRMEGCNFIDVELVSPDPPPEFAWATISYNGNVLDSRRFNPDGTVHLEIDNPSSVGEICLTVCGDDLVPYQADIPEEQSNLFVGYAGVVYVDGNNAQPNPSETISLLLSVKNYGSVTSGTYTAELVCDDPRLTITEGEEFEVPALDPNEIQIITDDIEIEICPWAPDGAELPLELVVHGPNDYISAIPIPVSAWTTSASGNPYANDEDDILSPGEEAALIFTVLNTGHEDVADLRGTISTPNEDVNIIIGESVFGQIDAGDEGDNFNDPFYIGIPSTMPIGERLEFTVSFLDENGAADSAYFHYYVGDPAEQDLTGPSEYGYWALDNTDDMTVFPVVPQYDWVNIRTIGTNTGLSDTGNEDDESTVVDLPFPFTYHGDVYDEITICSNGWFTFGACESITLFRNWPIPNPNGPPAMVAVFWDDLRTSGGGIYTYYDEENGRFIIEWDCQTAYNTTSEEFEAILYDPAVWPTSTGNGRILAQYQDILPRPSTSSDNGYATVGVESYDQQDGVEYYYWQSYGDGAEALVDGRAILFTDALSFSSEPPEANVNPLSFDFVLLPSSQDSSLLGISNTGVSPLLWSIDVIDGGLDQIERRQRMEWNEPLVTIDSPSFPSPEIPSSVDVAVQEHQPITTRLFLQPNSAIPPESGDTGNHSVSLKHDRELPGPAPVDEFGGPDGFGYVWIDSREADGPEYTWHSQFGTELDFGDDPDDVMSASVSIPFGFPFYGSVYTELWVCTNGYITFIDGQDVSWSNRSLPSDEAPNALVAPWWDDLDLNEGGSIHVWDNDTDSLVVTFNEVVGWGDRGGPYSYQAVLKSNGTIYFNYLDMGPEDDDRHDESTIGIQNEDHTIGLTVIHNDASADFIENEMSIRLSVPQVWLTVSDDGGVVGSGNMNMVYVRVSTDFTPAGEYVGSLLLQTNDPEHEQYDIPVTLTVIAGGEDPVVTDIPDQEIDQGDDFDIIYLDNYVSDPHYSDASITWSATGQVNLSVIIANRIALVAPIDPEWFGEETITFTAENPEGLTDSDPATFTINFVDRHPVVSDIPDMTVDEGQEFDTIQLDDYVEDPFYDDSQITWTATGQDELTVNIVDRVATILVPDDEWYGAETVTFTATNPENLTDSDDAVLTVTFVDDPPTTFALLSPVNGDSDVVRLVEFSWEESTDPDGGDVEYILAVTSEGDTATVDDISEESITVDLETLDLPILPEYQQYRWWVWASDESGNRQRSNQVFRFTYYVNALDERPLIPEEYAIGDPYPNPFNPSVTLEISLPENAVVQYAVHDILGREVERNLLGQLNAGYHLINWNADQFAAGVYFVTVETGAFTEVRKVILLK